VQAILDLAGEQYGLFTLAQWKGGWSLTIPPVRGPPVGVQEVRVPQCRSRLEDVDVTVLRGRPTESELEDDFLELVIRRYDLPLPVRQHPVGRRRIDFAYPGLVLGVELESVRAHAAREDVYRNASKANELLEWWILRFTFEDVHRWPEETAELLDRTIAKRRRAA
jgi:very-short-patch-repair endonuclease